VACPVVVDLTRHVAVLPLGELSVTNLTPGFNGELCVRSLGEAVRARVSRRRTGAFGFRDRTSGRYLTLGEGPPTVGMAWLRSNEEDMWLHRSDRTLAGLRMVIRTCASGRVVEADNREPTTLFQGDAYKRCLAGSSSHSWLFALI
jgi:hypothetical protein